MNSNPPDAANQTVFTASTGYFCESLNQFRIAASLAAHAPAECRNILILADWRPEPEDPDLNVFCSTHAIRLPDGQPPGFASYRAAFGKMQQSFPVLVSFQDQSVSSWALIDSVRDRGGRVVLIQDGFLSFDLSTISPLKRATWPLTRRLARASPALGRAGINLRAYDVFHDNHFFGHTRPDLALVFGKAMQARLERQFGLPAERCKVIGPLLDLNALPDTPAHEPAHPPRLLTLVQPSLRYGRMHRDVWIRNYLPFVAKTVALGAAVRLHPSQSDEEIRTLRDALPAGTILHRPSDRLTRDVLQKQDLIITANSTGFIEARSLGIPVLTYRVRGGGDQLPDFDDRLIYQARDLQDLEHAVQHFRQTGTLPQSAGAEQLSDHFHGLNLPLCQRLMLAMESIQAVAAP